MSDKPNTMQCPLCGFSFDKASTVCTHGCPLGRFCKLIKCPSCQYEFPDPSRPFSWVARLIHPAKPQPQSDALNLTQLTTGETAEFVGLSANANESRRHTLSVYGLVPGATLILQQKRPTYIVRVGETELAIESDIAREILVNKPASSQSAN